MPFDEGFRLDDQRVAPIEQARQRNEHDAANIGWPSRRGIALLKQSELSAKKEVLGDQRDAARHEISKQNDQGRLYPSAPH
jgi:hypothetical protein